MKDDLFWARDLAGMNATVMHVPTLTVGMVKSFFPGQGEDCFLSSGTPMRAPVIELVEGHVFLASDPQNFVPLNPAELRFYRLVVEGLQDLLREVVTIAARVGAAAPTMMVLAIAALRSQVNTLEAQQRRFAPPPGGPEEG